MKLTALSLLLLVMPAQADPLGRLFHTPEQRALLDVARKTLPQHVPIEVDQPEGQNLSVSGVVTRSDGKRTQWINGRTEYSASHSKTGPADVRVKLPDGEIKMKVGQSLDPATGHLEEGYRRSSRPAPPQAPVSGASSPSKPATPEPHGTEDESQPR